MKRFCLTCVVLLSLVLGCGQKKSGATTPASLDDLNRALTVVTMRSGSFPPSTNELAAFLAISGQTMTIPPPGKKLVLDPNLRQFVLVDQ